MLMDTPSSLMIPTHARNTTHTPQSEICNCPEYIEAVLRNRINIVILLCIAMAHGFVIKTTVKLTYIYSTERTSQKHRRYIIPRRQKLTLERQELCRKSMSNRCGFPCHYQSIHETTVRYYFIIGVPRNTLHHMTSTKLTNPMCRVHLNSFVLCFRHVEKHFRPGCQQHTR